MWWAVRSCCCLAFLLGWESCPRIISEQEPFLPQVDFIRGFLPQQQKETRAGFRAPLPAVSKDSDSLVLHDSGFISNLSWASASKKYHKNEWSEKWNKGKQTHKMQASFLLLVLKDKVKFMKLLQTFLNGASQKAWTPRIPMTALGWHLRLQHTQTAVLL